MNCLQHIQSNGQVGNVCSSHAAHQVLIMCSMLCNTYSQMARLGMYAAHMQHIRCLSCAACCATHTVKWPGWECMQLTCSTSGAYHVQHVVQHIQSNGQVGNVCSSHAAHQVLIMCNMLCATWYKGTALDRVEITFILALCHWLNPLTAEGEEETRVPREHPRR